MKGLFFDPASHKKMRKDFPHLVDQEKFHDEFPYLYEEALEELDNLNERNINENNNNNNANAVSVENYWKEKYKATSESEYKTLTASQCELIRAIKRGDMDILLSKKPPFTFADYVAQPYVAYRNWNALQWASQSQSMLDYLATIQIPNNPLLWDQACWEVACRQPDLNFNYLRSINGTKMLQLANIAIEYGNVPFLEKLMDSEEWKTHVVERTYKKYEAWKDIALLFAVCYQQKAMAAFLLKKDTIFNPTYYPPFPDSRFDHIPLYKFDVYNTPLSLAAQRANKEMVVFLLKNEKILWNINQVVVEDRTALSTLIHFSSRSPRCLDIAKILIENGANVHICSPLTDAMLTKNEAVIQLLLKHGAKKTPDMFWMCAHDLLDRYRSNLTSKHLRKKENVEKYDEKINLINLIDNLYYNYNDKEVYISLSSIGEAYKEMIQNDEQILEAWDLIKEAEKIEESLNNQANVHTDSFFSPQAQADANKKEETKVPDKQSRLEKK